MGTPVRMKEKGVIRDIIKWEESRTKLYWRLRRKLAESELKTTIKSLNPKLKMGQKQEMLRRWFIEDRGENERFAWDKDKPAVDWLLAQIHPETRSAVVSENLKVLKRESALSEFKALLEQCPDLISEVGVHLATKMSAAKRAEFVDTVTNLSEELEQEDEKSSSSKNGGGGCASGGADELGSDNSSESGEFN